MGDKLDSEALVKLAEKVRDQEAEIAHLRDKINEVIGAMNSRARAPSRVVYTERPNKLKEEGLLAWIFG